MRTLYCFILIVCFGNVLNAQILNIPQQLKIYLLSTGSSSAYVKASYTYPATSYVAIDVNHNNEIELSEAALVQSIHITKYSTYAAFLDGLEQFPNLKQLIVSSPVQAFNAASFPNLQSLTFDYRYSPQIPPVLSSLNLSGMIGLEEFFSKEFNSVQYINFNSLPNLKKIEITTDHNLGYSAIESIDFTGLGDLEYLSIPLKASLPGINFSQMPNLEYLRLGCRVPVLDITPLLHLETFDVQGISNLTSVIHGNLPSIKNFTCSVNPLLASLDLQGMPNVETIRCNGNSSMTSLTFSPSYQYLVSLNCSSNQLQALNPGAFPFLQTLDCSANQLVSLNLTGLNNLQTLNCRTNQLTSLTLTGLSSLQTLNCRANQLASLNLTGLSSLRQLGCSANQLASLNLTGLSSLRELGCGMNQLTSLNLIGLNSLWALNCIDNSLVSLTLTGLTNLEILECYDNSLLSVLNLSGLSGLKILNFAQTQIQSVDVSGCINLRELNCANSQLTALNVNGLTYLEKLYCQNNHLSTLQNAGLHQLAHLNCSNNQLTAVDISDLSFLYSFYCEYNQLTTLDMQAARRLNYLFCGNNLLTSLYVKNNCNETTMNFPGNPNLNYVCADTGQMTQVQNLVNSYGYTGCVVANDCFVLSNPAFETADFILSPNPAQDHFDITMKDGIAISSVALYNTLGQLVSVHSGASKKIDVSGLKSGHYIVKIIYDRGVATTRFVKE